MATDKRELTISDCVNLELAYFRRQAEKGRFDNDPMLKAMILASVDGNIDKVYDCLESPLA